MAAHWGWRGTPIVHRMRLPMQTDLILIPQLLVTSNCQAAGARSSLLPLLSLRTSHLSPGVGSMRTAFLTVSLVHACLLSYRPICPAASQPPRRLAETPTSAHEVRSLRLDASPFAGYSNSSCPAKSSLNPTSGKPPSQDSQLPPDSSASGLPPAQLRRHICLPQ